MQPTSLPAAASFTALVLPHYFQSSSFWPLAQLHHGPVGTMYWRVINVKFSFRLHIALSQGDLQDSVLFMFPSNVLVALVKMILWALTGLLNLHLSSSQQTVQVPKEWALFFSATTCLGLLILPTATMTSSMILILSQPFDVRFPILICLNHSTSS